MSTSGNKKEERKVRVPLGVPRMRLQVEGRQGWKRRWVNDRDGRLEKAIEGGYRLVPKEGATFKDLDAANRNDSINNAMSKIVNDDGTKAYLMEIQTSLYNADQAEKQKMLDETENALREGADSQGGRPGVDGRYIPREGIKIKR